MRWQRHDGQARQVMRRRQARNEREGERRQRIESGRKHAGQSGCCCSGRRVLLRLLQELFDIRVDFQLVLLLMVMMIGTGLLGRLVVAVVAGAGRVAVARRPTRLSGRTGLFGFALLLLEDSGRDDSRLSESEELLQDERLLFTTANAPHFNRSSLSVLWK